MSAPSSPARPAAALWSAAILSALLVIAAALLFAAIYIAIPAQTHFWALLVIGILSLFFALASYLAEALSRNPLAQRSFAWGFFGMGFAVLFGTIILGQTYGVLTLVGELIALVVIVLALVVAVAFIGWRSRTQAATQERLRKREAWQASNPSSALDYSAAHTPSAPQVPTPPMGGDSPPRSP